MSAIRNMPGRLAGLSLFLGGLMLPSTLPAQVTSNQAAVQLSAQPFSESLTLSVSPGIVNFTLSSNSATNGDNPLTVNTQYVLDPSRSQGAVLTVWFYFADPSAALLGGAGALPIPADRVYGGQDPNAMVPFTTSTPFGGSGMSISTSISGSGTATLSELLRIDATGMSLTQDEYHGTLFIQAQAL